MRKLLALISFVAASLMMCSCGADVVLCGEPAPMYPDYTDITIPCNIAPLNFLLRIDAKRVELITDGQKIASGTGRGVVFSERMWRDLLESNVGRTLTLTLRARTAEGWKEYRPFTWKISPDKVDPYLTYRLIEPDYEAYNNICLEQRCVENFDTDEFSDSDVIGNKCMNCHTYAGQDPDNTMFYVRGKGGGALLNRGGKLQKLTIKADGMISGSVYFGFDPSKRYITFSTNKIIPSYHALPEKRMEVFDTKSDVAVADLDNHKFIHSPLLESPADMETFPTFSADGKRVFYCVAPQIDTVTVENLEKVRYSLCSIDFDPEAGAFGTQIDTLYSAASEGHSVCHPRVSPDGRFICFTIQDYGTFPLWHMESDLVLIDLEDGSLIEMPLANSDKSDTYHSWSSNSRWLVFASKRDDGIYGKPYFTHVDADGNCSKAFVLPQKRPAFYDNFLKSFNAPELGRGPLPFDTYDVLEALKQEPIPFE